MATSARSAHRNAGGRAVLYLLFAALIAVPVAAFALGPLTSDDVSLKGPGGPMLAFSAGVLSFVSPCVLPLVPVYITHLSGATVSGGRVDANRWHTFAHAVAFVAGLSLVFIALGASAGLLGSYFLRDHQRDIEQWSGGVLMVMGVVLMPAYGRRSPAKAALLLLTLTAVYAFVTDVAGLRDDRGRLLLLAGVLGLAWLRFAGYLHLSLLQRTFQLDVAHDRRVGYSRSAIVGAAWGFGWTPCIGPVLAGILTLAAESADASRGTYLLVAYSAGLGIPFLITGLMLGDASAFFRRISRFTPVIEVVSGLMLIAVGAFLFAGRLTGLNDYFTFADFNEGL